MYPMHLVGFYLTLLSFGTLSLCKLCVHAWTEGEQEPLLKCHAYQYQQQTFEQTTSSFLLPDEIVVADCSSNGHWPLTKSCKSSHSGIFFDPDTQALFSTGSITPDGKPKHHHASFVHQTWNISTATTSSAICAAFVPHAIFMPIAYDEVAYQTEGSNYYVTHTDSLLPLWNVLKKRQKATPHALLPEIFLFAFNVEGKIDLSTRAFDDFSKYWIQSLQLLLGDVQVQVGTTAALSRHLHLAVIDGGVGGVAGVGTVRGSSSSSESESEGEGGALPGALCFGEVLFGAPQFNPTRRAVRSFSQDFRRVSKWG
mgnify:FL=1